MTQRIKPFNFLNMTQRIKPFSKIWRKELNPFSNKNWTFFFSNMTRIGFFNVSKNWTFLEYDSKNWKNWTLLGYHVKDLNFFFYLKIWLKELNLFFDTTQRIVHSFFMTQILELFWKFLTQRSGLFSRLKLFFSDFFKIWLKELNFFSQKYDSQKWTFFFEYDSQKLTFFSYDAMNWNLFLEYDSKNWSFFFFFQKMTQRIELVSKHLFLFLKRGLKELNLFYEHDSKIFFWKMWL